MKRFRSLKIQDAVQNLPDREVAFIDQMMGHLDTTVFLRKEYGL